jgi:hypothetical protein
VTLDIGGMLFSPFNLVLTVEVLMQPTLNTYQATFFLESLQMLLQPSLKFLLSSYQL